MNVSRVLIRRFKNPEQNFFCNYLFFSKLRDYVNLNLSIEHKIAVNITETFARFKKRNYEITRKSIKRERDGSKNIFLFFLNIA